MEDDQDRNEIVKNATKILQPYDKRNHYNGSAKANTQAHTPKIQVESERQQ